MITAIILSSIALAQSAPAIGGHGGHDFHHGGHDIYSGGHDIHNGGHDFHHGGHGGGFHHGDHYAPPKYEFAYGVKDSYHGTNFGHSETRDGYNAKGEYYVHLPDGRLQKVSYYTDKWGYHPTVTYEGKAHFPVHGKAHHGYGNDLDHHGVIHTDGGGYH